MNVCNQLYTTWKKSTQHRIKQIKKEASKCQMHFSREAIIYTAIISLLTVIAIVFPTVIIQGFSMPRRFILLGNSTNFTERGTHLIYVGIPPNLKRLAYLFHQSKDYNKTPTAVTCVTENTTTTTEITDTTTNNITTTTTETNTTTVSPSTTPPTTVTAPDEKEGPHFIHSLMTEPQLREYLETFVQLHDIWYSLHKIGQSQQGRNINNVVVMKPNVPKPIAMVLAGLLGQDWFSSSVVVHIMNKLVENIEYSSDLLNFYNFHLIPLLNPDGYTYSWSAPPINSSWRGNAAGINIVYDFQKFSAKESHVFKEHFLKYKSDVTAIFILHSPQTQEETCDIPKKSDKYAHFKEQLTKSVKLEPFHYKEIDSNSDRIDDWVVETAKPKTPFVLNIKTDYRLGVKKEAREFIKEYGDKIYRIITKILYTNKGTFQ